MIGTMADISVRTGLKVENKQFKFGTVRVVKKMNGEIIGWLNCNEEFMKAEK